MSNDAGTMKAIRQVIPRNPYSIVKRGKDVINVYVEMPGSALGDINVHFNGPNMRVTGTKPRPPGRYIRDEILHGPQELSITMPFHVTRSHSINVDYVSGIVVVSITIPEKDYESFSVRPIEMIE